MSLDLGVTRPFNLTRLRLGTSPSRLKSTTWIKCDLTRLENTIDLSRLKTDLDKKKSVLSQVNRAMVL